MKNFTFLLIWSIIPFLETAYVVLPDNFPSFIRNASEEVKKYFFDNKLLAVDYLDTQSIAPSSNCLNASIDNPSLLIYCLIIALIWLATVATGLFFYFRAIFKKLTNKYYPDQGIELQHLNNSTEKDGFETDRKIIVGK